MFRFLPNELSWKVGKSIWLAATCCLQPFSVDMANENCAWQCSYDLLWLRVERTIKKKKMKCEKMAWISQIIITIPLAAHSRCKKPTSILRSGDRLNSISSESYFHCFNAIFWPICIMRINWMSPRSLCGIREYGHASACALWLCGLLAAVVFFLLYFVCQPLRLCAHVYWIFPIH